MKCPDHHAECSGGVLIKCGDGYFISADKRECIECPSNSTECDGVSFECQKPFEKMGDSCVIPDETARNTEKKVYKST